MNEYEIALAECSEGEEDTFMTMKMISGKKIWHWKMNSPGQ